MYIYIKVCIYIHTYNHVLNRWWGTLDRFTCWEFAVVSANLFELPRVGSFFLNTYRYIFKTRGGVHMIFANVGNPKWCPQNLSNFSG